MTEHQQSVEAHVVDKIEWALERTADVIGRPLSMDEVLVVVKAICRELTEPTAPTTRLQ